jgi:hypothetical protein
LLSKSTRLTLRNRRPQANPDFGRGFRVSVTQFSIQDTILPQPFIGLFLCLLSKVQMARLIGISQALRQRIRQYSELCLITRTLTQIGLQLPIKTIRQ